MKFNKMKLWRLCHGVVIERQTEIAMRSAACVCYWCEKRAKFPCDDDDDDVMLEWCAPKKPIKLNNVKREYGELRMAPREAEIGMESTRKSDQGSCRERKSLSEHENEPETGQFDAKTDRRAADKLKKHIKWRWRKNWVYHHQCQTPLFRSRSLCSPVFFRSV